MAKRSKDDKIFRGAYNYYKGETVYAEETFEVYKDRKEFQMTFEAQILSRVSTGELLMIDVNYTINKEFIPVRVMTKRSLGKQESTELYTFDTKRNNLVYTFENNEDRQEISLNTGPKFHIATPVTCCSMLFLRSKKFDTTTKNLYSSHTSYNQWEFQNDPIVKTFAVRQQGLGTEKLALGNSSVQAKVYYLIQELEGNPTDEEIAQNQKSEVTIFLSPYQAIPYMLKSSDGNRIQVKYLNDLQKDD
jgi:hypothetical protein